VGTSVASRVFLSLPPLPEVERSIFSRRPNRRCIIHFEALKNVDKSIFASSNILNCMNQISSSDSQQ
jgi:hypothetical protein